jgi:NAD(P)-dependent dehydrogenase (short-subunit alcohol dehydrogenase family)
VVLATGGARGITAEALREVARPGNTLVLTGRSTLPEAETPAQAALDGDGLRRRFIAEARTSNSQPKPADIERKVQAVLAAREMRANIEDFRAAGATVEYHAIDVTDENAMHEFVVGVYQRFGRIDGVVHGAGVIEDKLLGDKNGESWARVVETKVLGLLVLQKLLRSDSLRWLTVFSSVAGRFGNAGQTDYATANELMNRLCWQLRQQWQGRVTVSALCWGPWGATQFGAGMVTPQTAAKFAASGVELVSPALGRRLFVDALARGDASDVEIVCGTGPWQHEGDRREPSSSSREPNAPHGPMLGSAPKTVLANGDHVFTLSLDASHTYLQQHRIDAIPVLPAAAALELMAEAARTSWSGWKVVEARECRLMKGIEVNGESRTLSLVLSPPGYGSSEGFDVTATLQSEQDNGRTIVHYKAVLRLEQRLPLAVTHVPEEHSEKKLSVAHAYDEWLFHGPCFQVIEGIDGMSTLGAAALVRSCTPRDWMRDASSEHQWVFDPGLVDAAAQMALLWGRAFRGESALPARFGRVVRYRDVLPKRLRMAFEQQPNGDASAVRANVYYLDDDGEVVMLMEDMECIASAALNRLGGTARRPVQASA